MVGIGFSDFNELLPYLDSLDVCCFFGVIYYLVGVLSIFYIPYGLPLRWGTDYFLVNRGMEL